MKRKILRKIIKLVVLLFVLNQTIVAANKRSAGIPDEKKMEPGKAPLQSGMNDKAKERLSSRFVFTSEAISFSNADFRNLDESSPQSIEYTDDSIRFVFSRLNLFFHFSMNEGMDFFADLSAIYNWGYTKYTVKASSDQKELQSTSPPVGFYLDRAFFRGCLFSGRENELHLFLGRNWFRLNDIFLSGSSFATDWFHKTSHFDANVFPEYIMESYADMIAFEWKMVSAGWFIFGADLLNNAADLPNHSINYSSIPKPEKSVQNFQGDVQTIRAWGIYRSRNLFSWKGSNKQKNAMRFLLYTIYTRYSASAPEGQERTLEGTSGNFPDGDWNTTAGIRSLIDIQENFLYIKKTSFTVYGEFAASRGNNYRLPDRAGNKRDISSSGMMTAFGMSLSVFKKVILSSDYAFFSGPQINEEAEVTNYGFVAASQTNSGGFLMNDYWNMNPSAYVSSTGIQRNNNAAGFASGMVQLHTGIQFLIIDRLKFRGDLWYLKDNSEKPQWNEDYTYGDSRSRNSGSEIGYEFDASLTLSIRGGWDAYIKYGIFFPGGYFDVPGKNEYSAYGSDPFTGFQIGMRIYMK